MQFDPKISFWLGVFVTALIGIGGGTVSLTHAVPPDWIPTVVAWCNILSFLGSAVLTALHGFSSGNSGPFVPAPTAMQATASAAKVSIAVLAVGLALAYASTAAAQAAEGAQYGAIPAAGFVALESLRFLLWAGVLGFLLWAALIAAAAIVAAPLIFVGCKIWFVGCKIWRRAAPRGCRILCVFGACLCALALGWAAPAQAQSRLTGNPLRDIGNAASQGNQKSLASPSALDELAGKIRKLSLDDFKYAAALAHATGNTVTAPCWDVWVKLLTAQQQPLNGPDGQPLHEPDPHLATDVERLSEMIHQLLPNSELSVACAPMASAAQKDAGTLIGAVLNGGALGLFKLPFAIP
jgi:hypothetical protein